MKLTHRYKAWLMLEADTPLSMGSGRESLTVDRLVIRNAAGFPYIPGTGLAGPLRQALSMQLDDTAIDTIFGFAKGSNGQGSQLIVNSAHLLAHDGKTVLEGIPAGVDEQHEYYQSLNSLPERDYVSINHRGTAVDGGKFDAELLHKGLRFVGCIELLGTNDDEALWQQILQQLAHPSFRIGGGTRKGYGRLSVVKWAELVCDLRSEAGLKQYLEADNTLNLPAGLAWKNFTENPGLVQGFSLYDVSLNARDVFLFGAGYGDDEADATYKTERFFEWKDDLPSLVERAFVLVPGTSVKGALRHRVSYHYNVSIGTYAEDQPPIAVLQHEALNENLYKKIGWDINANAGIDELEAMLKKLSEVKFEDVNPEVATGRKPTQENKAVITLFGFGNDRDDNSGSRGNVIINDVYLQPEAQEIEKIFDHVRIDRYIGGASDGALFQEKTVVHKGKAISFQILVKSTVLQDPQIADAWHKSLNDLCNGQLQLGGRTTKGHGIFEGTYSKTEI